MKLFLQYIYLLQDRERESMRVTPLGFCLRVIVNEKPLNLEKTTSSVLSVLLLIYVPATGKTVSVMT